MSLDDLGNFGEAIGGLAVVICLLFVGFASLSALQLARAR